MSRLAIRLSILALSATTLVLVSAMGPATAKTGHSRHAQFSKHRPHWKHHHYDAARAVGPAQPAGFYNPYEPICPAIGKSFDCKIWPPPYADDPDRKTSRH